MAREIYTGEKPRGELRGYVPELGVLVEFAENDPTVKNLEFGVVRPNSPHRQTRPGLTFRHRGKITLIADIITPTHNQSVTLQTTERSSVQAALQQQYDAAIINA